MSENEAMDLRHLIIDEADASVTTLEGKFIDGKFIEAVGSPALIPVDLSPLAVALWPEMENSPGFRLPEEKEGISFAPAPALRGDRQLPQITIRFEKDERVANVPDHAFVRERLRNDVREAIDERFELEMLSKVVEESVLLKRVREVEGGRAHASSIIPVLTKSELPIIRTPREPAVHTSMDMAEDRTGREEFAERVMVAYDRATEWNGNGFILNAPKFRVLVANLYEREIGHAASAVVKEGPDAPGVACFALDGRRYIIHEIAQSQEGG